MAVSLPPPLVPQLGSVEELRARAGGAMVLTYQDFQLHVFGSPALDADQLTAAIQGADNLSNAVRALASAYYAAGYPAAQLVYALSDKNLYIMVLLGQVTTAAGPKYLTKYFEGMDATLPFTDRKMEPRRTLASLHADRAGDNATPLFVLQRDGTYQFDVRPDKDGTKQTFVRTEMSNPGNRFVGRYFGDVDFKQNTRWGDEIRFFFRRSLDFLNEDSDNVDYTEYDLAWNRVTTYGVWGAALSHTLYHLRLKDVLLDNGEVHDVPLRGELTYGELDWFGLIMASFHSRWTAQARLGRTSKTLDGEDFGIGREQHELYNWSEVGTQFSYVRGLAGQQLSLEGGVGFGKGLSHRDGDPVIDPFTGVPEPNLNYFLWKPSMRAQLITSAKWTFTLDANGQITNDSLPEQQQWVVGGLNNASAYLPGVAVGDSGFNARFSAEPVPTPLWGHFKLVPRPFVEYAFAKFENVPENSALLRGRAAVADAGLELSMAAWDWLDVSLTWAEPFYERDIGENELTDSKARLYFKLAGKFGV
jgi:hemolysin activation/secretion protein